MGSSIVGDDRGKNRTASAVPLTMHNVPRRWWVEPQVLVLALVVLCVYFTRLTTLTIRGEESRRARVAAEILESGDWIVPRQQGQIYLSRPPLGSYPIALVAMLRGKVDAVAVRLPTVTAILLTAILIYGYARTFLSANGALAAGLAFATMGQVLEIGRLAETEATFTLLVSCSLLFWHWGYSRGWSPTLTWSVGYAFAALAGLTKGPQGPVYFVAAAWMFLLVKRDWRTLVSWQHAVGAVVFAVVLGSWQVPYFLATDLECSILIWTRNAAQRFEDNGEAGTLLSHLATYPLEVIGCMLPWSLLLLRFFDRRFLATIGGAKSNVQFLITAIAVTFPSVWFASTAKGRYYMPLYPCFAILVGLVIDRCLAAEPLTHLRTVWRHFSALMATGLAVAAIVVAAASWFPLPRLEAIAQPALFAGVYLVAVLGGVAVMVRSARSQAASPVTGLVAFGCLIGLTYTGVAINARAKVANDAAPAIAELKSKLPPGEQLVSFGRVDHLFAYLYEQPIGCQEIPVNAGDLEPAVRYFCINKYRADKVQLPFAWEPVAMISLDRNRTDKPQRQVMVGRRVDSVAEVRK